MFKTHRWDAVALTGSVIGILSLFLGWLTLKPNRLAEGTGLNILQSFNWLAALIILPWLFILILSLYGKNKNCALLLGICANTVLVITFIMVGLTASRLMLLESVTARVSLSGGVWLTLTGVFISIFAVRSRLISLFWRNTVSWVGLVVVVALLFSGWLNELSILREFASQRERFIQEALQHIYLFGGSIIVGVLIGVPLGIWAVQSKKADKPIFLIASIFQTIPSLALFGLLIAPLAALSLSFPILRELGIKGIGAAPAVIALIIYSLFPIIQNTYAGLRHVDPGVIEAGKGMGMRRFQIFRSVEAPLAAPIMLEGVRTAAVQAVGNTAVAALIGAGGLGQFIFQGLGQAASDLIILGAIPIIVLALLVDSLMKILVDITTPRGLRVRA